MATARAPNLNLCAILSESKRIINAHSRHFLALSVIFLLPLSFSLVVFPTLFHLILTPNNNNSHIHILIRYTLTQTPQTLTQTQTNSPPLPFSFPLVLFSLFLFLFSLFSLATITHSVFHGFFGRPVKLLSAITFTPLLILHPSPRYHHRFTLHPLLHLSHLPSLPSIHSPSRLQTLLLFPFLPLPFLFSRPPLPLLPPLPPRLLDPRFRRRRRGIHLGIGTAAAERGAYEGNEMGGSVFLFLLWLLGGDPVVEWVRSHGGL